jgi:hypothetical protein
VRRVAVPMIGGVVIATLYLLLFNPGTEDPEREHLSRSEVTVNSRSREVPISGESHLRAAPVIPEVQKAERESDSIEDNDEPNRTSDGGEQLAALRTKYGQETRDSGWSAPAEARVLAKLARMTNLKADYVEAECRTSLCRVAITLSSFPPSREVMTEFLFTFGASPWDGPVDGRTISVYIDKDGVLLGEDAPAA